MALVSYPLGLPKPLQKNYKVSVKPAIVTPEPNNGKTDNKLISYNAPFSLSCSIMLITDAQYDIWESFIGSLHYGNDYFLITLFNQTCKARIQSGKWTERLVCNTSSGAIREINLTLDVEAV